MDDDKAAKKEEKRQAKAEANANRKEETKNLSIGWQYTIGVVVVIPGFISVAGIGWSTPAKKKLLIANGITEFEFTWIASAFPLGAAFAQILAVVPIAMQEINPEYIFYAFAMVCFLGIVFTLLFVVETNQKTFEEIQADIAKHKVNVFKIKKRETAA